MGFIANSKILRAIRGGDDMGKLAVLDISETGRQIGEKLFAVLDSEQKKELTHYFLSRIPKVLLIILLALFQLMIHGNIRNAL